MISSCNEVISAEVPNALREIAKSIKDKDQFRQLSDEKALKELKNGSDEASKKFKAFLDKHGHRGYREMDPLYLMWRDDPIPCIKTIKVWLENGLMTSRLIMNLNFSEFAFRKRNSIRNQSGEISR